MLPRAFVDVGFADTLRQLQATPLSLQVEPVHIPTAFSPLANTSSAGDAVNSVWERVRRTGCARNIVAACKMPSHSFPVAVLLKYCYEGDNVPDAVSLAVFVASVLGLGSLDVSNGGLWATRDAMYAEGPLGALPLVELKTPKSWTAIRGGAFDMHGLY